VQSFYVEAFMRRLSSWFILTWPQKVDLLKPILKLLFALEELYLCLRNMASKIMDLR